MGQQFTVGRSVQSAVDSRRPGGGDPHNFDKSDAWVLADNPRALSDEAAFPLLVLALAGVLLVIGLAIVGVLHLLP
jgi:hypothetical protein